MNYPARQHAQRTLTQLLSLLPESEKQKTHIFLLAGGTTPFRNDTDRELPFRQESNFFYLTGCAIPRSHLLVISSNDGPPRTELFIPPADPAELLWSIPPPTLADASATHDADIVHPCEKFNPEWQMLAPALPVRLDILTHSSSDRVLVHTLPRDGPFPHIPTEYLSSCKATMTDRYLLPALHHARLTKTPAEIALIRHANAISSRAHEVVMRVLGLGVRALASKAKASAAAVAAGRPALPEHWLIEREAEAEALFVASCRREGAVHQSYMPIVAGSVRASTLHYCCNDKELAWGPVLASTCHGDQSLANGHAHGDGCAGPRELHPQVLLIDAGCEWDCYASDITRTMPVGNGGKFTKEAGEIYDLVLGMQTAAMKMIKPGVHWDDVHLHTHQVLTRGFLELGIFKRPSSPASAASLEAELLRLGLGAAFYPHGLGHSLGLDVHDVPSASKPVRLDERGESHGKGVADDKVYEYLRLRVPLQAGMVVTIEPGIYFHPHLLAGVRDSEYVDHEVLRRYEEGVDGRGGVGGVRIEDVVLITESGCENLTMVGKERAWVERVCGGEDL